jgi:hypothetical protein
LSPKVLRIAVMSTWPFFALCAATLGARSSGVHVGRDNHELSRCPALHRGPVAAALDWSRLSLGDSYAIKLFFSCRHGILYVAYHSARPLFTCVPIMLNSMCLKELFARLI